MKIALINTYESFGGAAIACHRLFRGLLQTGMDCRLVVKCKQSDDDLVIRASADESDPEASDILSAMTLLVDRYIINNRTDITNTIFSLPHVGYNLSTFNFIRSADVINLHWVADFQSPSTIRSLLALGKPVVWTLHDQWPFTGGCHFSAGCEGYRADCAPCPQLAEDPFRISAAVLRDKLSLIRKEQLTIVTPSRWLANCARQSVLFAKSRIEVIPNGLDTEWFTPIPKDTAKRMMGFDPEKIIILMGAHRMDESRKGGQEALAAIGCCLENSAFRDLVNNELVTPVCFGAESQSSVKSALPMVSLGYLDSVERMSLAYAAADMFLLPSLEDNLPNTMLEAMSCGTPVIAFRTGGIPDAIVDGVSGRLVEPKNVTQMAEAIVSLAMDPDQCRRMGEACRLTALRSFALDIQARRYLDLFDDLTKTRQAQPGPLKLTRHEVEGSPRDHEDCIAIDVEMGSNLGTAVIRFYLNLFSEASAEKGRIAVLYKIWVKLKQLLRTCLQRIRS